MYTVLVNDLWSWQDGNPRLVAVDRVGLLATTCDPQGAIATTCDPQGAIILAVKICGCSRPETMNVKAFSNEVYYINY